MRRNGFGAAGFGLPASLDNPVEPSYMLNPGGESHLVNRNPTQMENVWIWVQDNPVLAAFIAGGIAMVLFRQPKAFWGE